MSRSRHHTSSRRTRRAFADGRRYVVLLSVFLLAFAIVAGRLLWVQVIEAPALNQKATAQRLRDIELPPRRGTIYDREGEPLAVSMAARTVFASPSQIPDKRAAAQALAASLGGDRKSVV